MNERDNISEEQLDELLREIYLEDGGINGGEDASFVLEQEYFVKINPEKEKLLIDKLVSHPRRSWFWRYFPAGLGFVVVVDLCIMFFHLEHSMSHGNGMDADAKVYVAGNGQKYGLKEYADSLRISATGISQVPVAPPEAENYRQIISYFDSAARASVAPPVQEPDAAPLPEGALAPAPLAKEAARFHNLKNQILSKMLARDKKLYTTLVEGKIRYRGQGVEIDSYAMRNFEVTNIEYKAFLVDLLLQGRTEDYRKAQVDNSAWAAYGMNGLAESYFKDEAYDDFPVVNISAEAALLFCRWLEEETNALLKKNNPRAKPVKVRLPYDVEWIHAARVGTAQVPDCRGYNTIFDIRHGAVDESFLRRMAAVKRHHGKGDSSDYFYTINRYGMSEAQVLGVFRQGIAYANSNETDTLYPRRMKTLCKVGHVSEMILSRENGKVIVMGACWNSKEEFLKMKGEFDKASASPFIGFRPVIIAEDATEYKRPFW